MSCNGNRSLLFSAAALATILLAALPADAGTYSAAVLLDNPVAYYRLNETTGVTAANLGTAGAAIDGTYVNIPGGGATGNNSLYGDPGPRPTDFGGFETDNNSVFYDPSTDNTVTSTSFPRVQVPVADTSNPLVITGALTVEAWVKRSAVDPVNNNNQGIVGRYVGNNGAGAVNERSFVLYFDPSTDGANGGVANGNPGFGVALSTSGANQATNSYEFGVPTDDVAALAPGTWAHVALVFEPGVRVEAYLNGESLGTVTSGVAAGLSDTLAPLWIGQQFSAARQWTFDGHIDEVAIYAAALSDTQIKAHFDAAVVPEPAALVLLAGAVAFGWFHSSGRKFSR
jgi:hypothetical protein